MSREGLRRHFDEAGEIARQLDVETANRMVERLARLREEGGRLFLAELPPSAEWAKPLGLVSRHRQSSETFHAEVAQTRAEHVYSPKLEWIQSALRMQGLERPSVLEVVTPPSAVTALLNGSGRSAT